MYLHGLRCGDQQKSRQGLCVAAGQSEDVGLGYGLDLTPALSVIHNATV